MTANPARPGSAGRAWPGYASRLCPICRREVGTHREPIDDERDEMVIYHQHDDTAGRPCQMDRAAIRTVAFTGRGR